MSETKTCNRCLVVKPLAEFSPQPNGSTANQCKTCRAFLARKKREEESRKICTVDDILEWKIEMQARIRRELGR